MRGLSVIASRTLRCMQADAEELFRLHSERPFLAEMVKFNDFGTRLGLQVLEGEGAIAKKTAK